MTGKNAPLDASVCGRRFFHVARRYSIYRVSWRTAALSLSALGAQLVPYAAARALIKKKSPGPQSHVNGIDRAVIGLNSPTADHISIAGTALAVAAPLIVDWFDAHGELASWLEDALVLGEAIAIDGLVNTIVKYAVRRPLPVVYAGQAPQLRDRPRGYRAFFSGHVSAVASLVTSGAMAVRLRHPRAMWQWIGAGALVAVVAVGRMLAGKHFPTDVIVGAVVGSGSAVASSFQHRRSLRHVCRRPRGAAYMRWW